jgi:archaellum biogenesis protein FlaJ (TadC family)
LLLGWSRGDWRVFAEVSVIDNRVKMSGVFILIMAMIYGYEVRMWLFLTLMLLWFMMKGNALFIYLPTYLWYVRD